MVLTLYLLERSLSLDCCVRLCQKYLFLEMLKKVFCIGIEPMTTLSALPLGQQNLLYNAIYKQKELKQTLNM